MRTKIVAVALAVSTTGLMAQTVHFVPGPFGGTKMITPWGDFVAIPEGNSVWVGTVEQYMHNKADSIMERDGYKHVKIEGEASNIRRYINTKIPTTEVGKTTLHEISTSIVFDVEPDKKLGRPPKPKTSEYVALLWTPSNKQKIVPKIVSIGGKSAYSPNICKNVDGLEWCEFTVKRDDLISPMSYVFFAKGYAPGVVQVESIAKQHYSDSVAEHKSLRMEKVSDEEKSDLLRLHELDASIPVSEDAFK